MNRLSFLKKLSVGIAAAVITPKAIRDIQLNPIIEKEIEKMPEPDSNKFAWGHYEEPFCHDIATHNNIVLWDVILHQNEELYMITGLGGLSNIYLDALDSNASPLRIELSPREFDKQEFILFSHGFNERKL